MQFHLNGYEPGDPEISDLAERLGSSGASGAVPEEVDVLIVGCGPAGLTLAAQLAAFPEIKTCIVEQKSGRLLRGQADGIACRTMEMFQAFGFAERVVKEGYWVNETSFWKPGDAEPEKIHRNGRVDDVQEGLSEFPHIILNQARVHDFYLDVMRKSSSRIEPYYGRRFGTLEIAQGEDAGDFPVTVTLERIDAGHEGQIEQIRARYVVGCDGARSNVRKAMGRELRGDSAKQAWGVMDLLVVTDFPDIRLKAVIQSADEGSIVLIPREGGYLARFYVELDELEEHERVADRGITIDTVIAVAQRILHPYKLDVKDVGWWSAYEIGQRLCDKFDDVPADDVATRIPRVFIAGDACHTHSPKAGQGMNVSMQDAFNLGWKLAAVLRGQSAPELLHSYSAERQAIAKELIDFDREWAKMLSAPIKAGDGPESEGVDAAAVQHYFVKHGHYTAGTATRYHRSSLIGDDTHQHLATGFPIGMRFHSAPVIRLADAKPMHLGHAMKADGRWRILAFCGREDPSDSSAPIAKLCDFLENAPTSPIRSYTWKDLDVDSVIDVRAVFQQGHRALSLLDLPPLLLPRKGRHGLRDYEKMFCIDPRTGDIFEMRGIDRERGCVVIIRPDQYVAHILPFDAHQGLASFFAGVLLPAQHS